MPNMGLFTPYKVFADGTSIHGFVHLANPNLSIFTRLTWLLAVVGALFYASYELNITYICEFI